MTTKPSIAILGGTGALGSGLAERWARSQYPVILGSRSAEKAQACVDDLKAKVAPFASITHNDYVKACQEAQIIVLAIPYNSHAETLDVISAHVNGKIVIDAVVPLVPPKVSVVQLPASGSAAAAAQHKLGSEVHVVGAFHNVAASKLPGTSPIACDVLICGDNKDAKDLVIQLANDAGMRGVDAGPVANSAAAEALTSVLIGINRRNKVEAGIVISGL